MATGSFLSTLENCFISHRLDWELLSMDRHVETQYANALNKHFIFTIDLHLVLPFLALCNIKNYCNR